MFGGNVRVNRESMSTGIAKKGSVLRVCCEFA